jgi:hypothetical protein
MDEVVIDDHSFEFLYDFNMEVDGLLADYALFSLPLKSI